MMVELQQLMQQGQERAERESHLLRKQLEEGVAGETLQVRCCLFERDCCRMR